MAEEKNLTVIVQREVTFYGDELPVARTADGRIYVPLKPICEAIGVGWNGQRQRINRDPVLSEVAMSARITR
ncbi:MAG: phage antirepressor N-terminal domain-containing protein, partial [Chloroflexi bacterium]|nr:phage antirepressor N-terminal domain-containing protein [Chloroflexota bacterium]